MGDIVELEASPPVEEDIERIVHRLLAAFDVEHSAAFVVDRIFARGVVRVAGVEIFLYVFVGYADAGPAVVHAVDLLFGRHVGGGDGCQRQVRRAAVGLRLLGVVCHAEDDLLQGVGVLAVVAAEEVGILRAERVAHAEDRFAGGFGLRPHRGAGINLGIEVHAGQQAVDRTLVGTRVVRACGRHRAFVRSQVGQLRDAVVKDILARGLFGVHTAAEGRGLGRERHVAEHVEGDPVEIGAQETGLGAEALDPGGQFAAHAAVGEFVRGGLAQVLVHVGDALQRTYVDGVGRVVVGVGPRVGIHGAYPGVVLPGAFAGVGRNLLDRPECADELRGAAVADLQVGGVVRDEIEIEFGEPGQVAVLVFPVDGLRGRVGRVEGQGVEIPDARSEQHRCACRRQGEMFYVDFHGSFVFRSLHSDAANRCAGAARSSRRCR